MADWNASRDVSYRHARTASVDKTEPVRVSAQSQSPRSWLSPGLSAPTWFRAWLALLVLATSLVAVRLGADVIDFGAAGSEFRCPTYRPLPPVGGGSVHTVENQSQLAAAMKSAAPGDTINLSSGVYQEIHYRPAYGHRAGTAGAPIVIQAGAGAKPIIDGDNLNDPNKKPAVLIANTSNVTIRGLEVRNRFFGAMSWGSSAVVFEHNNIHSVGHSAVIANAFRESGAFVPSKDVVIRCNRIHRTGLLEPEYGEGIYLGTGIDDVADTTSQILIEGNEIFDVSNEAIDVKHHVTNVTIRHNQIHDATPYYGGAISLGLNKHSWGSANYRVEHNQIWNIKSGLYYGQAIAVAHGPTTIRHNTIWNVETSESDSWPWTSVVQVHGDDNTAAWAYGFGNPKANLVEIVDNTIIGCARSCIDSTTDRGQIQPRLVVSGNVVDAPSTGDAANDHDRLVSAADLIGPLTGTADAGTGPGSGLEVKTPSQNEPVAAPAPSTTSTTSPRSSELDTDTATEAVTVDQPSPSTTVAAPVDRSLPGSRSTTATADDGGPSSVQSVWQEEPTVSGTPVTATAPVGSPASGAPSIDGSRPDAADGVSLPYTTSSPPSTTSRNSFSGSSAGKNPLAPWRAPQRSPRRPVPGPRSGWRSNGQRPAVTTTVLPATPTGHGDTVPPTTVPSTEGPPPIVLHRSDG